jgi:putative membrane protein
MRLLATLSAAAVLLAVPVRAQSAEQAPGNPAGTAPLTPTTASGMPAPDQLNQADRLFIRQATLAGTAEVELAKLAQRAGRSPAIEGFAARMVEDHGKANERLSGLARQAGVTAPQGLGPEHRAMQERLEKLSGAEFDRAYIKGQVQDHQKAALLLVWEIGSGQDAGLKGFASETLPAVLRHLQMAQGIAAELSIEAAKVP